MKQSGQSTIEFILTFAFGLGIIFLFVNVAVNYSAGYLVHYSTFMAARTYLSVEMHQTSDGANNNEAKREALNTFSRFRMQALGVDSSSVKAARNGDIGFHINPFFPQPSNSQEALFIGAYSVFERPISFFRIVAGGDKARHISEAFLGKEPTRYNCWEQTCAAIQLGLRGTPTGCERISDSDFTVFDNGC